MKKKITEKEAPYLDKEGQREIFRLIRSCLIFSLAIGRMRELRNPYDGD